MNARLTEAGIEKATMIIGGKVSEPARLGIEVVLNRILKNAKGHKSSVMLTGIRFYAGEDYTSDKSKRVWK